ncbi:molybdate ABC transporter permease subunit [Pleionea sediminis]|uniref:molybdate ABC transporter permease subunit n=1 Tax=Pleionea sediminis TaxID=2569479 RepID=UPI001186EA17|nr:molybdate ABC transporter permease subunit [Pleionea sediminis]
MMLSPDDWLAIGLTIKLAVTVVVLLLLIGTPIAWWLATTTCRLKSIFEALIALPLVLPPTVIGFYLLMLMSPDGFVGQVTQSLGLGTLPFTFSGIVIASIFYSLPFVVQPLQNTFQSIGKRPREVAATLGASPFDTFFSIVVPLSKKGFLTASILGFAHTLGEFGVILMVGGNIPGATRVISVQIYDHVESLNYAAAHWLSAIMIVSAFLILMGLSFFNREVSVFGGAK